MRGSRRSSPTGPRSSSRCRRCPETPSSASRPRSHSQTGARLTTADGADVTLASGGGRNRVVYTFAPGESSRTAVDVFSFSPALERTGSAGAGTGFYQVTIGPIGAGRAHPRAALDSGAPLRRVPAAGAGAGPAGIEDVPVSGGAGRRYTDLHDLEHGDRCDTVDDPGL